MSESCAALVPVHPFGNPFDTQPLQWTVCCVLSTTVVFEEVATGIGGTRNAVSTVAVGHVDLVHEPDSLLYDGQHEYDCIGRSQQRVHWCQGL